MEQYEKKGYLNSEFRLFHLTDQETKEVDYHYHDFDKITIFIRGKVNYMIEGRSYDLKPYDIVLVKQGDIHRLTVDNSCPYERIIVYISPNFMNAYQTDNYDLSYCFQRLQKNIPMFCVSHLSKKLSVSFYLSVGAFVYGWRLCFRALQTGYVSGIYDTSEPGRKKEPARIYRY